MDRSSLRWRKSRHSGTHGHCVEVAVSRLTHGPGSSQLMVRDSKNPDGAVLAFTPAQWEAFIAGIKDGEFGATG